MQFFRYTLVLAIVCLAAISCKQQTAQKPAISPEAAEDSLTKFLGNTVNPLFHDHEVTASRRILDSLAPIISKQENFSMTCTWLRFQGVQYKMEKKFDSAMIVLRRCLAIAEVKDSSLKQVIAAKTQLAGLFLDQKKTDSALLYARESYYLAKKIDTSGLPTILMKLVSIYQVIGDLPQQRKYLFEGLSISKQQPKFRLSFASNIAKYYDESGQKDSAILFYRNFVNNDTSLSSPHYDAIKYENLGIILMKEGRSEEGLKYQLKALQLNRDLHQLDATTIYNTAVAYSKLKRFATSEQYLDEAMAMALDEGNHEIITAVWRRRSEDLSAQHRYQEALAALDSAFNNFELEVDSSITTRARELETQYAVKAKDDEIRTLAISNSANQKIGQQQNLIILTLVGAFLLLILLGIVLWRRRKLTEKLKQTALEQQLLRSQMEPHFIFNTLSVLQSFIRNNEGEKAIRYLSQFARLLRITLENSRESFVPLKDEIVALENYLSLQAMRFEGAFDYSVEVFEMHEEDDLLIPPMLLQPFVENAILHGMKQLNHKGHICVTITREQQVIRCVIEDDGSGLQSDLTQSGKRSLATVITRERLAILSRQTGQPASITFTNKIKEQRQGTRVLLSIPFRKTRSFSANTENES